MRTIIVFIVLLLSGCASPSPFWMESRLHFEPKVVRVFKTDNLSTWCRGATEQWYACTTRDYSTRECVIYIRRAYFNESIVRHEKCHCRNFDHNSMPSVGAPSCPVDVDSVPHTVEEWF